MIPSLFGFFKNMQMQRKHPLLNWIIWIDELRGGEGGGVVKNGL